MKISGFFNAFSIFASKSQPAEETPCRKEQVYVLSEINNTEEFTDENIKCFLDLIGKYF